MKNKIFLVRIIEKVSFVLISTITLKDSENTIQLHKKTFAINVNKPAFVSAKFHYFVVDYDNAAQLNFNALESSIKPEQLDLILSNKIIKELTSGIVENKWNKITPFILGCFMGGLTVAVIALIVFQTKMEELYNSFIGLDTKETIPILRVGLNGMRLLWKIKIN